MTDTKGRGFLKTFFENGTLASEEYFVDFLKDGPCATYDATGRAIYKEIFEKVTCRGRCLSDEPDNAFNAQGEKMTPSQALTFLKKWSVLKEKQLQRDMLFLKKTIENGR